MSEWKVTELKNIILAHRPVTYGIVQPGPDIRPNGIPLIRGKDYSSGKVDSSDLYHVKPEIDLPYKRSKVLGGDILFSIAGYVGQVAIVPQSLEGANITQTTARISVNTNSYSSAYIFYYLISDFTQTQVRKYAKGSAQEGLNLSDVEKIRINFPSLQPQFKIAHILSTIDSVIEKTQSAIDKYKAIKQGMLHDLFTRGIDIKTGKLRPRYQEAPELYKESKLGWIPNEWEIKEIGNVSSLVTNGFVGIATPYYTTADKGVPYLYGTNIREDSIEFNDLRYISREFNNSHIKSQLKPGDMLCVQSGHIGTCAVVPDNFVEANCHALIITRFYKEIIYPEFISFYLNSSIGQHHLDKIIIGSTIKHINTSDLAKHLIPIPLFEEQKEISRRLLVIDQKLRTEQNYFHKLQMLKSGLMSDLLSGKKRVKVDNEDLSKTA